MSNPLVQALAREEGKLVRQETLRDSTVAEMEILGANAARLGRQERQNKAIVDTKANITKLKKAVDSLK